MNLRISVHEPGSLLRKQLLCRLACSHPHTKKPTWPQRATIVTGSSTHDALRW